MTRSTREEVEEARRRKKAFYEKGEHYFQGQIFQEFPMKAPKAERLSELSFLFQGFSKINVEEELIKAAKNEMNQNVSEKGS